MDTSEVSSGQSTPAVGDALQVWSTLTHYGAVDWARGHHDLCVVDSAGTIVFELAIDDTSEDWASVCSRLVN